MTQNDQILRHLKRGGTITQLQAFNQFGCCRLSERIRELKRDGHKIHGYMCPVKTRHGRAVVKKYYLVRQK